MSLKYDNALSHLRLYRVKDIIILNVYYHCADDLAYFDSLDKFYQSSQKHIKLTKKKKKIFK